MNNIREALTCAVCDNRPVYSWTDTHGIAQCSHCGTPYVLYHYEGEEGARRRVDRPPECVVREDWIPLLREYWQEHKRPVPGGHSFPGGQEVASRADAIAFNEWAARNAHRAAPPEDSHG